MKGSVGLASQKKYIISNKSKQNFTEVGKIQLPLTRMGGRVVGDTGVWVPALTEDIALCSSIGRDILLARCLSPPRCINGS